MYLLNLLRRYKKQLFAPTQTLLRVELHTEALKHNIGRFATLFPHHKLIAVLKSNAYGHGLKEVGELVECDERVHMIAVDSVMEAIRLRDNSVTKPLLILGYVPRAHIKTLTSIDRCVLAIGSLQQLNDLVATRLPLEVQLKVDTGMHRQGVMIYEVEQALDRVKKSHLIMSGILSHFADADTPQSFVTQEQKKKWEQAVAWYKERFGETGLMHIAATAGSVEGDVSANAIRMGIGMYGYDVTPGKKLGVRPALSLCAKIVNIKTVPVGGSIGYNATTTAEQPMRIAVIPCGYYEALPRALSNKGCVYVRGQRCPIVGRVSMNLATIDISALPADVALEEEVEVFSSQETRDNSIEAVARQCETIPYEIMIRLAHAIRRVVV